MVFVGYACLFRVLAWQRYLVLGSFAHSCKYSLTLRVSVTDNAWFHFGFLSHAMFCGGMFWQPIKIFTGAGMGTLLHGVLL